MYADHQPQAVDETRKHERFRDFPDTEEVTSGQGAVLSRDSLIALGWSVR